MTDNRERKTVTSPPSEGKSTPTSQLLASPPHVAIQARVRKQRTPKRMGLAVQEALLLGNSSDHRLDMQYVVRRLLAEGDDTEETLTRVCTVLRDAMGWNEVSFWPAEGQARVRPSASALVSSGQRYVQPTTARHVAHIAGIRLVGHVFTTGEPACVTEVAQGTQVAHGSTFPHASLALAGGARSVFAFPVRGTHTLLGVIECLGGQSDSPDTALLGGAASLGPAIGLFIERQREIAERRYIAETEHVMHAESAAWASRLEAVCEALADSAIIFDCGGRILQTNSADRTMFGYDSRSSGYTSTVRERGRLLMLRDERDHPIPEERSPFTRVLRGETLSDSHAVKAAIRLPDGQALQVSISGAPLYDGADNLIGGIVVTRDATERKHCERSLRDTNRRMKEFLAVAAHDLRTPIASSKGYVQLATKRLNNLTDTVAAENPILVGRIEDVRKNLEDAERSTQRLALLVDRLMDVARIQTGKLELHREATNLAAIIRTAVQEQQLATPARMIRSKLPPTLAVSTVADPTRVGQVLMNYLANALKYSSEDSPVEITLTMRRAEARVSVRDEGSGIPLAQRKRIWSRFEQLESASLRRADTGLGLGLYISRAIIEAHGGHVGVRSMAGRGSTFWFSLPLARPAE